MALLSSWALQCIPVYGHVTQATLSAIFLMWRM
jgi:hypothetical protein